MGLNIYERSSSISSSNLTTMTTSNNKNNNKLENEFSSKSERKQVRNKDYTLPSLLTGVQLERCSLLRVCVSTSKNMKKPFTGNSSGFWSSQVHNQERLSKVLKWNKFIILRMSQYKSIALIFNGIRDCLLGRKIWIL